jgi:cyclic beta-1,2-glucan synthetase
MGKQAGAGVTEPPLRAELFSVDQLATHGRSLAASHHLTTQRASFGLLDRLDRNEEILRTFNRATMLVGDSRRITPAAEWLLDNFYLVEEQVQLARRHLPRGYSRELPRLQAGVSKGLPRVYDIVLEFIAHVDAQIEVGPFSAFVSAYQEVSLLKLGELWAIPIMLRLGLIENLQRITSRLITARNERALADQWVDRLQDVAEKHPSRLVIVVAEMAQADLPLSSAFVAEFCQRLSRQNPVLHLARSWLDQRLAEQGLSIEQLIHQENQVQAADQVSVSHSIGALRYLGATDWKEFVESLSVVDHTLRSDPADVYSDMDFATRDRYRHVVESLARYSRRTEAEVAAQAIALASAEAEKNGPKPRMAHVGYFLVDDGRPTLEQAVGVNWPWGNALERGLQRYPLSSYLGGICLLTALGTLAFVTWAGGLDWPRWQLLILLFPAVLGLSQLATALVNWVVTLLAKPERLPRLDYSSGIASDRRAVVAIPTLLTSRESVDHLVENLELHYLANRDDHLHFALLTDLRDAAEEVLPGDAELVQRARSGVERLNRLYSPQDYDRFYLFHRSRRWNGREQAWMGHERKRGKLADFNSVLRDESPQAFSLVVGRTAVLRGVKYVLTLDTDTQLPRDVARQLVATMAHPLNEPQFDERRGIVTAGYAIMQPRVGASLAGVGRSWYARLFAGDAGIDPYTRAVSDVYQDLFGEGSFIGKGIYDVDAFEHSLGGRIPENTVLSHDLLESCHARCALVTDLELYEDHPARYLVDTNRRHRWIRGDWQIARWLGFRVRGADGQRKPNPLSILSQWKILDNLRRSLVPIALLLVLLGGWLLTPDSHGWGALLVLVVLGLPVLLATLVDLVRKPSELPWKMHVRSAAGTAGRQFGQLGLRLAFLPHEALVSLDAISRTLWRLVITRRRLLEWQTSSDAERQARGDLSYHLVILWVAPVLAIATGVGLAASSLPIFTAALPLLTLWLLAPVLAWWISRSIDVPKPGLSTEQLSFLRRLARKTWRFFETYVNAEENGLPPDNIQEVPTHIVATRTSPTNLGLALLSNLAARDFGYVSVGRLIERTKLTLGTMHRLERHRGHFYNWYDTRTLQPLHPWYVSSVDSGNLAGHLLTLAAGLRELAEETIFSLHVCRGVRDTLQVLRELIGENPAAEQLDQELAAEPATLPEAHALLERAAAAAGRLAATLPKDHVEARRWAEELRRDCEQHVEDLRHLAPWLTAKTSTSSRVTEIPILRALAETENGGVAAERAYERVMQLDELARQCDEMAAAMDFTFLYDPGRELFSIGYNVSDRRRDSSYYDLLASEARLGSFVAIAQGQVPQDHWFSMGRLLVATHGDPILVSWSGSMFEYLMPLLVMPHYDHTLLAQTCRAAVAHQIEYGRVRGVPWGISESGYHRTDAHQNYQYKAFGVPGLGLKRGLAEDLVVAPYATVMALMVDPQAACDNLQRLSAEGREGAYGFYEAIDYTPSRLPPGESSVMLRSFMVHHQGMSFLALAHVLRDAPMHRRFLACPMLKATSLLLQERVPRTAANVLTEGLEVEQGRSATGEAESVMRVFTNPNSRTPEVHLLSNGRYHVAITNAGGGYSRWHDLSLTRWREDATRDCWGAFIYLRDPASGEFRSAAHQPTLRPAKSYEAIFTQGRAEFRHHHNDLETHTAICVSPEDDVELRRLTLRNRSGETRIIELTTFAEVVLAAPAADLAHPAFSNLFVQTEFIPETSSILCTRRARAADEHPPWMFHLMVGDAMGEVSCETDRVRFVGRGGNATRPAALQKKGPLSNTDGSVLDPIISLRREVTLSPYATAVINIVVGGAGSRDAAVGLVSKYQHARMVDRAFDLAWTHSQVTLRQLDATEANVQMYGRLASALIYADPARRAPSSVLRSNRRGQSGLWSYGISGDFPLVLLQVANIQNIGIVRELVQAHSYWRVKGLAVELVILNEDVSVYRQSLQEQVTSMISAGVEAQLLDKPGGIFVRRLEQISAEDRVLMQTVARIVLDDESGTLAEQLAQRNIVDPPMPKLVPTRPENPATPITLPARDLIFRNGLGGFTRDGHEYVITLQPGQVTPAPWVNVIANPFFGTVVSESGAAYTWVENAHEFRLTPWSNDPVQDTAGEALYLRDEQTGQFWSPTPGPARGATPYVIRHGFGYTVFEHTEFGIYSELWVYVAIDAPVKFSVLKLRNVSGRPRRVSVTGYWEWVLGDVRQKSLLHVQTTVDLKTGTLLARNPYNTSFADRVAFVDVNEPGRTHTGDRKEFLGRNGTLAEPAAMKRIRLSGKVGASLDPCTAVQVAFDLADGQERETQFRLGVGRGTADVQALIQRFRRADAARTALEEVWGFWNRTLGAINVDTPDPAVNVLANGWLLYQTLSCRIWGRTGFYQSGGAYGFRDQLQDVMALVHAEPTLTREHLLRAAAQQFREGDVQHWWHPPEGRGVRTHFSDDYLWLPYVTCRYVKCVADTGVLDEKVPFLQGRLLRADEEAHYDLPQRSEDAGTLYEHCVRAVEHALTKFGVHGLPLIGCGDWNDGMNMVGKDGRGESVWLAFFLYDVLMQFSPLAQARGDGALAERCLAEAKKLQENIEANAWDGEWYRRAYFDNGEPLGSQTNEECQIDSLPQSWSVISGAGDPARSRQAMQAVEQRLVRKEAGLIQLFDPPFDRSDLNPGYIKGYIPGVRENGGQYTHGALWTVMAMAQMGENERAWELFTLLNPAHHGSTPEAIATYKVEPYVAAADVYGVAPHTGRGGWTWYTGSAGWMYRLLVETLLGAHLEGTRLRLEPRLPQAWSSYKIHYRYKETVYHITISRGSDGAPEGRLLVDGQELGDLAVPLVNDQREHFAELTIA